MLIRHIESKTGVPPQKVFLDAELVIRGSTRALEDVPRAAERQVARPVAREASAQAGTRESRRPSPRDARPALRR
jgi:hypothetical protein